MCIRDRLLSIDLGSKEIDTLVPELANLDGVVRMGEHLFVNDWITGELFQVSDAGEVTPVETYPAGLADIAAYGETLYLPLMFDGVVQAVTLGDQ